MDKYEYLIQRGKSLKPMDSALKTQENAISGCQSRVWIASELNGDFISFYADSDTLITRGLIALLLDVLDRQPPDSIVNSPIYFIDRVGLRSHLSPSRANGLLSIIKHMKWLAEQRLRS